METSIQPLWNNGFVRLGGILGYLLHISFSITGSIGGSLIIWINLWNTFWFLLFYFFICLVSGFWWYVLVSLIFPSFGKGAGKEGNDINIKIIFTSPLFIFLSLCDYNWFFNNNLTKCQKIKVVFSIFSITKLSLHLYDPSFIRRI